MEMFTRDMILTGPPADVRSWAIGIAEAFGETTGRTPEVWASIVGGTAGHHTWAMPIDGTEELTRLTMQALGDEDYLAFIEEGRQFFVGQPRDSMYRSLNGVEPVQSEPGAVCTVTTAVAAAGSLGHAVGWGIEVSEHITRITGLQIALLGMAAGGFSRLTWMGVVEDAARADEVNRQINTNEEYLKLIARGGGNFVDGTGQQQQFLRIG